jgi:hypothetical protein
VAAAQAGCVVLDEAKAAIRAVGLARRCQSLAIASRGFLARETNFLAHHSKTGGGQFCLYSLVKMERPVMDHKTEKYWETLLLRMAADARQEGTL